MDEDGTNTTPAQTEAKPASVSGVRRRQRPPRIDPTVVGESSSVQGDKKQAAAKRQVGGNLPYTSSVGVLKRALEKLIESEKPPTFNRDFMSTVLGVSGGAASPIVPIMKKVGLVEEGGNPTELYSEFQSRSGRANAALQALKNGFSDIFKRNQYAHKADKNKLMDIIRSITGLPDGDPIIGYISNTFSAFQAYGKDASEEHAIAEIIEPTFRADERSFSQSRGQERPELRDHKLGLSYQINIVIPETSNIDVLNAIFRSLRENLLR